jgi:hypothetical protein
MNRHPLRAAVTLLFAAPALHAAVPAKLPFTIAKETTVITAPLRADGTPDYVAALNEKYGKGVTPENNGFVAWLQITGTGEAILPPAIRDKFLSMCGAKPVAPDAHVWQSYKDYLKSLRVPEKDIPPAEDDFILLTRRLWKAGAEKRAATFLGTHTPDLDRAVEAINRPAWWMPCVSADGRSLVKVDLPILASARQISNALLARATLRAASGDFAGFMSDEIAVKRLARQVAQNTLIERLVGGAVDALADYSIGAVAGSGILNGEECHKLSVALRTMPPLESLAHGVDTVERWYLLDSLEELAVRKGETTGILSLEAYKMLAAIDAPSVHWDLVLRQVNQAMDQAVLAVKAPTLKDLKLKAGELEKLKKQWAEEMGTDDKALALRPGESSEKYTVRISHDAVAILLFDFSRAEELNRRSMMLDRMTDTLLALAQVKARMGRWPATLEEAAAAGVKDLPQDMYPVDSPGTVKYRQMDGHARVYSLGENGRDDGGILDMAKGLDDIGVGIVN